MVSIEQIKKTNIEVEEHFKNINSLRKHMNESILQKDENEILQKQIDELDDLFSGIEFHVRNEVRSIKTEYGSCILITDTKNEKQYPGYYRVKFNLTELNTSKIGQ